MDHDRCDRPVGRQRNDRLSRSFRDRLRWQQQHVSCGGVKLNGERGQWDALHATGYGRSVEMRQFVFDNADHLANTLRTAALRYGCSPLGL